MNRNVIVVFILTAALCVASAFAGQPAFSLGLSDRTIREMDLFLLNVAASDPQGHVLEYAWSITNDETNGYAFFRSSSHTTADFAVRWQSSALAGSLNGKKVTIQVVARHANPLTDGNEQAVTTATYTISGVNHPPIAVISGNLGTPTNRIPTGYGVCADAYDSDDPDGDTVRGDWGWGSWTGGRWKTTTGNYPPTLIGSEGGRCCFTVLDMSAPIDQNIELTLSNGLHVVKAVATCYLKPADAVIPTNSAPTITLPTNPVQVAVGATAQLVADVEDLDGDTLSYSFVFLPDNSTVASSAISVSTISSTKKRVTATIPAPTAGTFYFRFTARETLTADHKVGTGTITLVVGTGGGGTGPADGGPGDVTDTLDTCDTSTGGPPTITITPNPTTTKPLFKSGDSAQITVVSSDSSQMTSPLNGKVVKGVTITWNLAELTALGAQPSVATVARASDPTTSDSVLTFTAPTVTSTLDIYLTVESKDVLDCRRTVRFAIRLAPAQKPIANATAKVGSQAGDGPVDEGTVVTLDGSASSRSDGTKTNLTYQWTQTEGPNVTVTNADKAVAEFTAPAAVEGAMRLKFKLIVSDGATPSDPAELTINLSFPSFYFPQVAVGPLGSAEFRSVLLLVNGTPEAANGVEVRFFGQDGKPMDVTINGAPWDGQPFNIPPLSSERLVFTGQELKVGWAKVNAGIRLMGVLRYQVVGDNEDLQTQVGLYSTEAATKFATFYDPKAETAIAVANPSAQPATVRVRIISNTTGGEVVSKLLFGQEMDGPLSAMNHKAKFLTQDLLGQLPPTFGVGTLLVESDIPIAVTILETKGGVVFSTLPVRTLK